jgi:hypothetical protein
MPQCLVLVSVCVASFPPHTPTSRSPLSLPPPPPSPSHCSDSAPSLIQSVMEHMDYVTGDYVVLLRRI